MNEDWAEAVLDQMEAGQQVAPAADPNYVSPLNYTPEIAYLALIADRVLAVRSAVFAAQSDGHEQPIPTLPRPKNAMEKVRERRVLAELLEIERQIFGGGMEIHKE